MSKRLLRGVIDFGDNRISAENLGLNFRRLRASKFDFHSPDEAKIWTYVQEYWAINKEAPTYALIENYYLRDENRQEGDYSSVGDQLLYIKAAEVYVRTHYDSLLKQLVEERRKLKTIKLMQEAEDILSRGKVIDGVTWRGFADSTRYYQIHNSELAREYLAEPEEGLPLEMDLGDPGPFPLTVFPAVVADYCRAVAIAYNVPLDMVAWSALQVLALSVQRKLNARIRPDWDQPCVLWTLIVMPSGYKKSPIYKELMRPIRAWTEQGLMTYREARTALSNELAACSGRDGDQVRAREITQQLSEMSRPRVTIQNVTPSKMLRIMAKLPGPIPSICLSDPDKNRIADFNGRYGDAPELSTLHNGYDSEQLELDRQGDGKSLDNEIYIPSGRIGVFCLTQPRALNELLDPKKGYGDGVIGRLLIYVAPPKPKKTLEQNQVIPPSIPKSVRDGWDALIARLLSDTVPAPTVDQAGFDPVAELDCNPAETPPPTPIREVQVGQFVEVLRAQTDYAAGNPDHPWHHLGYWLDKLPGRAARAAAILTHVGEAAGAPAPREADLMALAQHQLRHASRVLGQVAAPDIDSRAGKAQKLRAALVADARATGVWVTSLREVLRKHHRTVRNTTEAAEILQLLDDHGFVDFAEPDRKSRKRTVLVLDVRESPTSKDIALDVPTTKEVRPHAPPKVHSKEALASLIASAVRAFDPRSIQ